MCFFRGSLICVIVAALIKKSIMLEKILIGFYSLYITEVVFYIADQQNSMRLSIEYDSHMHIDIVTITLQSNNRRNSFASKEMGYFNLSNFYNSI